MREMKHHTFGPSTVSGRSACQRVVRWMIEVAGTAVHGNSRPGSQVTVCGEWEE